MPSGCSAACRERSEACSSISVSRGSSGIRNGARPSSACQSALPTWRQRSCSRRGIDEGRLKAQLTASVVGALWQAPVDQPRHQNAGFNVEARHLLPESVDEPQVNCASSDELNLRAVVDRPGLTQARSQQALLHAAADNANLVADLRRRGLHKDRSARANLALSGETGEVVCEVHGEREASGAGKRGWMPSPSAGPEISGCHEPRRVFRSSRLGVRAQHLEQRAGKLARGLAGCAANVSAAQDDAQRTLQGDGVHLKLRLFVQQGFMKSQAARAVRGVLWRFVLQALLLVNAAGRRHSENHRPLLRTGDEGLPVLQREVHWFELHADAGLVTIE